MTAGYAHQELRTDADVRSGRVVLAGGAFMGNQIRVGELEIIALNDGVNRLPPMFFPGLDSETHPELVDDDGTIHCPIGCFLIRGPGTTLLVDAGFGPTRMAYPEGVPPARTKPGEQAFLAEGGKLPEALANVGC